MTRRDRLRQANQVAQVRTLSRDHAERTARAAFLAVAEERAAVATATGRLDIEITGWTDELAKPSLDLFGAQARATLVIERGDTLTFCEQQFASAVQVETGARVAWQLSIAADDAAAQISAAFRRDYVRQSEEARLQDTANQHLARRINSADR